MILYAFASYKSVAPPLSQDYTSSVDFNIAFDYPALVPQKAQLCVCEYLSDSCVHTVCADFVRP